jgi:hypothetical protein
MLCFVAVSAVITRDCTLIAAQYFVDDMFANFTKDNRTDDDCMHLNDTRRPVFAFKVTYLAPQKSPFCDISFPEDQHEKVPLEQEELYRPQHVLLSGLRIVPICRRVS